MNYPKDRHYTKDHEWVKVISPTQVEVGITQFAQSELGDLVFVDLPKVGKTVKPGEVLCVVESTKAASDVYAPVAGTVVEMNGTLAAAPELVNSDPHAVGWLARLEVADANAAVQGLLSAEEYQQVTSKK